MFYQFLYITAVCKYVFKTTMCTTFCKLIVLYCINKGQYCYNNDIFKITLLLLNCNIYLKMNDILFLVYN